MYEFDEYKTNTAWWWFLQILIAEAKCIKTEAQYKAYCDEVFSYMKSAPPLPVPKKKGVTIYGTR